MSAPRSEELIRELAEGLEPVRRVPRLRAALGGALALWAAVAAACAALQGLRPDLAAGSLPAPGLLAVLAGLAVAGGAGVAAALALGLPGRERLALAAFGAAAAGTALAAGAGALRLLTGAGAGPAPPLGHDATCLGVAFAVGLPPALAVLLYAARAAPFRPLALGLVAAAGAAALGGVAVQATCPLDAPRHVLLGHALAPLAAALLLALPLRAALRRLARASR